MCSGEGAVGESFTLIGSWWAPKTWSLCGPTASWVLESLLLLPLHSLSAFTLYFLPRQHPTPGLPCPPHPLAPLLPIQSPPSPQGTGN